MNFPTPDEPAALARFADPADPADRPDRNVRRPRILVIGGKLNHVRKARELGLDVVHAQFPDEYDRGHWPYVDQALLLDYGDAERLLPLVRALHAAYPL